MQPAAERSPEPGAAEPSASPEPWRARAAVAWGTLLAALVAFPALTARPWADERFIMYWPEKIAGARPWRLASQALREIPAYLDTGNFRPLSRFGFYLEHWAVVRTSVAGGLPPNVTMGLVKLAMIALVLAALILTLDQYRRAGRVATADLRWRLTVGATVVFFAASLALYNPSRHPLTLFPGLYLGATGMALMAPVLLGRQFLRGGPAPARRRRWLLLALWFVCGGAVASSIELAYLALPLGLAHLVLLGRSATTGLRAAWRAVFRSGAFRSLLALTAGFLVVFVPTRIAITIYCADLPCYRATEPAVGLDFLTVLPSRIAAGLFPVTVGADHERLTRAPSVSPEYVAIAVVVAALAFVWLRRSARRQPYVARSEGGFGTASIYLGAVMLAAAALGAMSSAVQDAGFSLNPWRETGYVWVAWSGLLGIGGGWVLARAARVRRGLTAALVVTAALVIPSTIVNYRIMERVRLQPVSRLHIEAGTLLVNFDRTPEGNRSRCAVIDGLAAGRSGSEARKAELVADFLDVAARNHWGRHYCDRDV